MKSFFKDFKKFFYKDRVVLSITSIISSLEEFFSRPNICKNMKGKKYEIILISIISFLFILSLFTNELGYINPDFMNQWDHHNYIAMSQNLLIICIVANAIASEPWF